jgi:hypothetical protein
MGFEKMLDRRADAQLSAPHILVRHHLDEYCAWQAGLGWM